MVDTSALVVVTDGRFVGVVTAASILALTTRL
jgi:hypothetical protein